jgi:hypothetical protein
LEEVRQVKADCCEIKTTAIKDGFKIEFTGDNVKECFESIKTQLENCDTSKVGMVCCGSDSSKKK